MESARGIQQEGWNDMMESVRGIRREYQRNMMTASGNYSGSVGEV